MPARVAKKKGKSVEIVQFRSGIGTPENHKRTLRSLGFRRLNQKVVRPDNPAIRGMVKTIPHLVRILGE
ncbi:MAG TPA: 50S ribosomal protein L30 [Candidatus Polarisedimenticolia bacterium]|jgi:large subunit ribosomal protein L30|nr:50S ribosomal protein L30 [Candidatus Polarisedimenticolia bacterium]